LLGDILGHQVPCLPVHLRRWRLRKCCTGFFKRIWAFAIKELGNRNLLWGKLAERELWGVE
jgi:hypothetical protein